MISPKQYIRRSFRSRLCFWVSIVALLVFALSFSQSTFYARKQMMEEANEIANRNLDKAVLFLDSELRAVEVAAHNLVPFVTGPFAPNDPERLYLAFESFLRANPNVQGVAIGFTKDHYKQYPKGFGPYVLHLDSAMVRFQLSDHRDYLHADWYVETLRNDSAGWTRPFRETNGSIISSYCVPLHTADGKVLGVLAVDISLARLSDELMSIKPYPNSVLTVLNRDFVFITHPNKDYIFRESIESLLQKEEIEPNESLYIMMKEKSRGVDSYSSSKGRSHVYFARCSNAPWTVTLECLESDIFDSTTAMVLTMVVLSVLGLIIMVIACTIVIRMMTKPIKQFADAAKEIAGGNFETRLPEISTHGELLQLRDSLDNMQSSLKNYINDLKITTQSKERIESELRIASKIQMSMVPKLFPPYPDRKEIDIFGSLTSAKAVGGDLFDFMLKGDDLLFVIGDVSGKGVPASLFMAVARTLFRTIGNQTTNPAKIARQLNDVISEGNDECMFVTMFIASLDLKTGHLTYCNAGHNAPVFMNSSGASFMDVCPNLPIGIMYGFDYQLQTATLANGEGLFLYTDGVTEAENASSQLYGDGRLLQKLQPLGTLGSKECVESILRDVRAHADGTEQSDDITMLYVKYLQDEDNP